MGTSTRSLVKIASIQILILLVAQHGVVLGAPSVDDIRRADQERQKAEQLLNDKRKVLEEAKAKQAQFQKWQAEEAKREAEERSNLSNPWEQHGKPSKTSRNTLAQQMIGEPVAPVTVGGNQLRCDCSRLKAACSAHFEKSSDALELLTSNPYCALVKYSVGPVNYAAIVSAGRRPVTIDAPAGKLQVKNCQICQAVMLPISSVP
jgi:hypothetical protein